MLIDRLESERLILRAWKDSDMSVFAELNADPVVMNYLPRLLTREESDARAAEIRNHFDRYGFGLWAVEIRSEAQFIGFTGLNVPAFDAPFTPCVEVGWRLHRNFWGQGYATEAARAAVQFGFDQLGLNEILSYTVPANLRSRRVMERLGMTHDPRSDFDHPLLPELHPLRRHVLYRLARPSA